MKKISIYAIVFLSGTMLSLGIFSTFASWNTPTATGNPLTAEMWNDAVGKLIELDARISGGIINFISPVNVYAGNGPTTFYQAFNVSGFVPTETSSVLLEAECAINGPDGGDIDAHIKIKSSLATTDTYLLLRGRASGSADAIALSSQGFFPIDSGRFFYVIEAPGFAHGCVINLIGYTL